MTINPNVVRITSTEILEAGIENPRHYAKERAYPDRIMMVDDPVGQRGQVAQVRLVRGDPKIAGSYRTELSRDYYTSEYAFGTGGGWYWWSYMLDPEWKRKHHLLIANPPYNDLSINIQQFHTHNPDPLIHPPWTVAVNERGVCLRRWRMDDGPLWDLAAAWPVDSLVWHDVVAYIYWSTGRDGVFELYVDDRLFYRHNGPTVYPGASKGCWWKQGIYAPGSYPVGLDELTVWCQGLRQVYPDGSYYLCCGTSPKFPIASPQAMYAGTENDPPG
ncbi:heparin lyase I family protein [Nitrosovibrio sp. Nv17]|jgi:hypothetical protein|uniref:heparin lyase I family protein n=1 Tax=Nitrosovibrio sp. Nv17 TaxID=1855339 RepID=UPI0009087F9D|nr:heparin lyase I family protein [Nitrosovibrio sp. Nv17]SFW39498.1 Polysaccharide lyase [Nitrosovibrio sp. Nv17]